MSDQLYRELRKINRLEQAWKRVRDNGRKSRSARTRADIEAFSAESHKQLRSIAGKFSQDSFAFPPSRGWAEPPTSPGKRSRPIVITPINARIVQRAILDVLLEQQSIQHYIDQPFSFGGIKKHDPDCEAAVPGAIQVAVNRMHEGGLYYIRSDISGFFRKIPKSTVMDKIREAIADETFCHVIDQAIRVELSNLDALRDDAELFPLEDIGVAQGCALSPLFGNILLSDFDQLLNSGECACIRYIDDFLILGPSEDAVTDTFEAAQEHLKHYGMEAYHPLFHEEKAEQGHINQDVLTFLGVEIHNGSVRPSKRNRGKLISSINEIANANTRRPPSREKKWSYNHSFLKFLMTTNNVVSGWGNQYYFCNDQNIMNEIDQKIDKMIMATSQRFRQMFDGLDSLERRRLIGVKSIHDCKVDPIAWGK